MADKRFAKNVISVPVFVSILQLISFGLASSEYPEGGINESPVLDDSCNNATLEKHLPCCECNNSLGVICEIFKASDMDYTLRNLTAVLGYHHFLTHLFVVVKSPNHVFPIVEETRLNLRHLSNFSRLNSLSIVPSSNRTHFYKFNVTRDTFKGSENLSELRINMNVLGSRSASLFKMLEPLKLLKKLDFSNTLDVSLENMQRAVCHVPNTIQELRLANFQTVGQYNYGTQLSPNQFFPGVLPHLTYVDLRDNGLVYIGLNWTEKTPNLKHLDVSHNVLTQEVLHKKATQ